MNFAALVGTLVIVAISSSIMWWLGRAIGRTRGTFPLSVIVAVLLSAPICWVVIDFGLMVFPVPAWLFALVVADEYFDLIPPAAGWHKVNNQHSVGEWAMALLLLFLGLVLPIIVFVASSIHAFSRTKRAAPAGR